MRRLLVASVAVVLSLALAPRPVAAQSVSPGPTEPMTLMPPLPPATRLEGFAPSAASLVTLGYDDLGTVTTVTGDGRIAVDVRELRDSTGIVVRGLVVEVAESKDRMDRSYIDADELPALIGGIDALLSVKTNPTSFRKFEVTYRTRSEFEVTALNSSRGDILYSVTAGRSRRAQISGISLGDLQKLKTMCEAAAQRLSWLANAK